MQFNIFVAKFKVVTPAGRGRARAIIRRVELWQRRSPRGMYTYALLTLLALQGIDAFHGGGARALRPIALELRGALEDGDLSLQDAIVALAGAKLTAARECVDRARACYAEVEDAATRADRESLAISVEAPLLEALEKTRAVRDAALEKQRTAARRAMTDTEGDALARAAAAALAEADYDGARARVDAARAAFARDGIVDREPALGGLYATINAEQERAANAAARREREKGEAEEEALRKGRQLVAEQRIAAAADEGGA